MTSKRITIPFNNFVAQVLLLKDMMHLNEFIYEQTKGIGAPDIVVDGMTVSSDLLKICFECDLKRCKGYCCSSGSQGAVLKDNEADTIESILPEVKKHLSQEALEKIEESGATYSENGTDFTQILDNEDGTYSCVFAIKENGCTLCAIDKEFRNGNEKLKTLNFCKPISCHLYPIQEHNGHALKVHSDIRCRCKANSIVPLYKTQKNALVRSFGEEWYNNLLEALPCSLPSE